MQKPEEEIKRLLLSDELDLLETLRTRFDRLETRVGDDPALSASISRIIVEVLQEAGIRDHDRLARTMAPLVVAAMREEIRNSRDMMVDALYPITGRLVAAAVRNAFQELLEKINRKIDDSLSAERWQVRLKARMTGRSEAEILLERNPPFEIEEILVIHKGTGLLVAHAGESLEAEGRIDSDLISGMLTAIMAFARDAMGAAESGELRTIGFAESEVFLRSSPAVILAVKASGPPPRQFRARLEEVFCDLIDRWGEPIGRSDGSLPDPERPALMADLQQRLRSLDEATESPIKAPSRKGLVVLAAAAAILLAWAGYGVFQSYRAAGIQEMASNAVAQDPVVAGYPIDVRYDSEAHRVEVSGLLPDAAAKERVAQALAQALPEVPSEITVRLLPRGEVEQIAERQSGLRASLDELTGRLAGLEDLTGQVGNSVSSVSGDLGSQMKRLEQQFVDLESMAGSLEKSIDGLDRKVNDDLALVDNRLQGLESPEPSSLDRLQRWTEEHAIFFTRDAEFKSPSSADTKLRALADLLAGSPAEVSLRVVGYSDRIGTREENRILSLSRAEAVSTRLAALKVAPERLLAVGRGPERALTSTTGPDGGNRRVEFEIVLSGKPPRTNGQQ